MHRHNGRRRFDSARFRGGSHVEEMLSWESRSRSTSLSTAKPRTNGNAARSSLLHMHRHTYLHTPLATQLGIIATGCRARKTGAGAYTLTANLHAAEWWVERLLVALGEGRGSRSSAHTPRVARTRSQTALALWLWMGDNPNRRRSSNLSHCLGRYTPCRTWRWRPEVLLYANHCSLFRHRRALLFAVVVVWPCAVRCRCVRAALPILGRRGVRGSPSRLPRRNFARSAQTGSHHRSPGLAGLKARTYTTYFAAN